MGMLQVFPQFLHDIGILTLGTKLTDEYNSILNKARNENIPLWEAENEILGSTHAEIGAYLLGVWGFADNIVDAIARHHAPIPYPQDPKSLVTIVHFADALAHKLKKSNQDIIQAKLDENYLKELNLFEDGKIWIKKCQEVMNQENSDE